MSSIRIHSNSSGDTIKRVTIPSTDNKNQAINSQCKVSFTSSLRTAFSNILSTLRNPWTSSQKRLAQPQRGLSLNTDNETITSADDTAHILQNPQKKSDAQPHPKKPQKKQPLTTTPKRKPIEITPIITMKLNDKIIEGGKIP